MSRRLKLPAYGKALLAERREGRHPHCVHVVYGEEWGAAVKCGARCEDHPTVCLSPSQYAPGTVDFHLLTGVQVALFDLDGGARDYDAVGFAPPSRYGKFYDLVGEIARYSATLTIHSPAWPETTQADTLAFCWRVTRQRADAQANHGWPRWWSNEIDQAHEARRIRWFETRMLEFGRARGYLPQAGERVGG